MRRSSNVHGSALCYEMLLEKALVCPTGSATDVVTSKRKQTATVLGTRLPQADTGRVTGLSP